MIPVEATRTAVQLAKEIVRGDHDSFVVLCDLLEESGRPSDLLKLRYLRGDDDLLCLTTLFELAEVPHRVRKDLGARDRLDFGDYVYRPGNLVWSLDGYDLKIGKGRRIYEYEDGSFDRYLWRNGNGRYTFVPDGVDRRFEFSEGDLGSLTRENVATVPLAMPRTTVPTTQQDLDQIVLPTVDRALEAKERSLAMLSVLEDGLGRDLL